MIGHYTGCESMLLLRSDFDEKAPALYHPLKSDLAKLPTGQTASYSGTYEAATFQGISCMKFTGDGANSLCSVPFPRNVRNGWDGTISIWVAASNPKASKATILRIGSGTFTSFSGEWVHLKKNTGGVFAQLTTSGAQNTNLTLFQDSGFHHVLLAVRRPGGEATTATCEIYLDGVYKDTISRASWRSFDFTNSWFGMSNSSTGGSVYLAALRVYDRTLSVEELQELANEFTPQEA